MNYRKRRIVPLLLAAAAFCILTACGVKAAVAIPPATAAQTFETVQTEPENEAAAASLREEAEKLKARRREALLDEAELLSKGYYYDEAIKKLEDAGELKNSETEQKAGEYRAQKDGLREYTGQVYHVFFHSLIVYPELAFTGDYMSNGYNMWMTTRDEFVKMLPHFLDGGYVLYDIGELIHNNADGTIGKNKIFLPEGKKPLVISIDDVCYYEYMKDDGFASRLTVNADNEVVTVVRAPDKTESETRDGDVMPIVDSFVREHPEFSYRGAKGVVAVTGYQGVFGYRITDLEGEELEKALGEAKAVADALKASGWRIANHSYTHNSFFRDGTMTIEKIASDIGRWKKYIEPTTGETNIFISPFGVTLNKQKAAFQYIVEQGYTIYCPVGAPMSTKFYDNVMVQERLNLDGYTMITNPERVKKHFFDPAEVLDPKRPPLK